MNRKRFLASGSALLATPFLSAFTKNADEEDELTYTVPFKLKVGATIGITSPAGFITLEGIQPALQQFDSWGLKAKIGTTIGTWYSEELKNQEQIKNIDYIIPVPLHKRRLRERGYNQVKGFGKALSENLKIPYDNTVLQRKLYTKTQTKKNLLGRSDVIDSVFSISFSENHHGKHFLLIDDVLTTGSTLESCSRALLKIPNSKISIICMAMSHN